MARREAKHLKALYFDLRVKDLKEYYPCLNHFEVANVGANHDLMQLFDEAVPELDML